MLVICFGELIIDFTSLNAGRQLWEVEKFKKNVGGAPANVAVGLHHHGIPVRLWSQVGNDSFGKFLVNQLRGYGISTEKIIQDSRHPTKLAFVGLDENGERYFEFHNLNSAELYMRIEDFKIEELDTARIFHFGGVALLGEVTVNTLFEILKIAKNNRTFVSFDPNIRIDLIKNKEAIIKRFNDILNFVNILKLSRDDWQQFFSNKIPQDILEKGISLLILTEGANGVRLISEKSDVFVPGEKVKVVDTTGAGDAFTAAFLSKLYQNNVGSINNISESQLKEWGKFANHWGAKIVQYPGAVIGYFSSEK